MNTNSFEISLPEDDYIRKIKLIKINREINQKYRYYVPIGKGEKFINEIGSGDNISVLFSAANGVGKTLLGCQVLAHLFWPCGNKFFQQPLFSNWPANWPKRGRIVSEPNTIKETIIPMLKTVFPKGRYGVTKFETNKQGKTYEAEWTTDTGWVFTIMSYDQDPKEFESANLGFVWEDEPAPRAIHIANVSRLRDGGVLWITETPLQGSAYLYDEYAANPNRAFQQKAYVEADIEDSCIEHGVRGFRPHEQIIKMVAQYTEDERQARIFGKFQHLTGLVFKSWSRDIHVIDPFDINEDDYVVGHALDPHPRNPDAATWMAVDKYNQKFIIDEFYDDSETAELGYMINKKSERFRMDRYIIDPSANIIDKHTNKSLAGELYNTSKLIYKAGSKLRSLAIQRMKNALDYRMAKGMLIKKPELYIFSSCTRTIWEFEHWQWDDWRGKAAERKDPKGKPVDKDDHMLENIGRLLLEDIQWSPNRENIVHTFNPLSTEPIGAPIARSTNDDPY